MKKLILMALLFAPVSLKAGCDPVSQQKILDQIQVDKDILQKLRDKSGFLEKQNVSSLSPSDVSLLAALSSQQSALMREIMRLMDEYAACNVITNIGFLPF